MASHFLNASKSRQICKNSGKVTNLVRGGPAEIAVTASKRYASAREMLTVHAAAIASSHAVFGLHPDS
jgi:hypothetical protein